MNCEYCKKDILNSGCLLSHIKLKGKMYERLKNDDDDTCGDCGTGAGKYHHDACDMETCPRCKEQAFGCDCKWTKKQLVQINKNVDKIFKTMEKGKTYKVVKSKTQSKGVKKYNLLTGWGTLLEFNKSEKEIKEIVRHKKNMSAKITFDDFSKHLEKSK